MLADLPALGRNFERSNIRPEQNENRLLAFMSLWRTTAKTELTHASVAKLQNEDWSAHGPGLRKMRPGLRRGLEFDLPVLIMISSRRYCASVQDLKPSAGRSQV